MLIVHLFSSNAKNSFNCCCCCYYCWLWSCVAGVVGVGVVGDRSGQTFSVVVVVCAFECFVYLLLLLLLLSLLLLLLFTFNYWLLLCLSGSPCLKPQAWRAEPGILSPLVCCAAPSSLPAQRRQQLHIF